MNKNSKDNELTAGNSILIVDDEEDTLDACTQILTKSAYQVDTSNSGKEALEKIKANSYNVVVADIKMPKMNGIELLEAAKKIDPGLIVIMITGYPDLDTAVEAMREGAYDYVTKPFTPEQLRMVIRKALERQKLLRENTELRERLKRGYKEFEIIGESEAIKEIHDIIDKVAKTNSTVLICGETGTGKELVAREIHIKSKRSSGPFIIVNCAAIPSELLESELFGHEKGAFTNAIRHKKGSFELANGGSLFLDEIGDMSLDLQAKLMRVLQEKEIKAVGSEISIDVDIRFIAATNKNLQEAMGKEEFRKDLYYRLNVVPIYLPPLRERREDIPLLAEHFLEKYQKELGRQIEGLTDNAMELLLNYNWPGNIRELENAIERAIILGESNTIQAEDFRQIIIATKNEMDELNEAYADIDPNSLPSLDKVERDYILKVLQAVKWNRKKASKILEISTVTIWRKVNK